jgi:hypothetical protein
MMYGSHEEQKSYGICCDDEGRAVRERVRSLPAYVTSSVLPPTAIPQLVRHLDVVPIRSSAYSIYRAQSTSYSDLVQTRPCTHIITVIIEIEFEAFFFWSRLI